MVIDVGTAYAKTHELTTKLSLMSVQPVELNFDYSIFIDKITGFRFAYQNVPFRILYDFSDPAQTYYKLTDPTDHKTLIYQRIQNYDATKLAKKILLTTAKKGRR